MQYCILRYMSSTYTLIGRLVFSIKYAKSKNNPPLSKLADYFFHSVSVTSHSNASVSINLIQSSFALSNSI